MRLRTAMLALGLALALSAAFSLVAWSAGEARRAALCQDAFERKRQVEGLVPGLSGGPRGRSFDRTVEDRLVQADSDVRSYCR
jgi:hypothetical protein